MYGWLVYVVVMCVEKFVYRFGIMVSCLFIMFYFLECLVFLVLVCVCVMDFFWILLSVIGLLWMLNLIRLYFILKILLFLSCWNYYGFFLVYKILSILVLCFSLLLEMM